MREIDFDEPVVLLTSNGRDARVATAGQATEWLLNRWTAKPGPKHYLARVAIVGLLEGR